MSRGQNRYVAVGCYWPSLLRIGVVLALLATLFTGWNHGTVLSIAVGYMFGSGMAEWDANGRDWLRRNGAG